MEITTLSLIIDEKRSNLENMIKKSDMIDEFDIEDLDDKDGRKDVMISFKEAVDSKFLQDALHSIFGDAKTKHTIEE